MNGEHGDLDRELAEAEAWAVNNVHLLPGPIAGKHQIVWIAQIRAQGQLFERRAVGDLRKRESLRARAAREVIRDYVEFVRHMRHG